MNFCYTDGINVVVNHCNLKRHAVEVRNGDITLYYDVVEVDDGTILNVSQWDYSAIKDYEIGDKTVTGIVSDTMSPHSIFNVMARYLEDDSNKTRSI